MFTNDDRDKDDDDGDDVCLLRPLPRRIPPPAATGVGVEVFLDVTGIVASSTAGSLPEDVDASLVGDDKVDVGVVADPIVALPNT